MPLLRPTRDVGIVFQEAVLLAWRTVLDNVLLPTEILGLDKAASAQPRHGFDQPRRASAASKNAFRASVRRHATAGVALPRDDPQSVRSLMDEPFAALDAMTREELCFELMRIWSADRKTVIFVTHNIMEAILLADRVVAMTPRPGRIAGSSTSILPGRGP